MSSPADSKSIVPIDPQVQSTYRRSAFELAPAELDSRILKLSRQAIQNRSIWPVTVLWTRPTAFAAMFVLSLAATLQFFDVEMIGKTPDALGGPGNERISDSENRADDLSAAVESSGKRLRKLDSELESLSPNNKPMPSKVPRSGISLQTSGLESADKIRLCEHESTKSADSWWQCIQKLQNDGMSDAARIELELFDTSHPSFDRGQ